jgi:DNA-binding transcriptional LysR family regulator
MKQNFTVRKGALDGVEAFLSVAQHRNFRRAAADLGVTPSAISQAIRALEARVGAALFIRTTRSVGLTEAGERFLSRAKPAFEELIAASEVARDLGQRPAGLLRLSVPRAVVPILLEPLIASFCQAYPEIELEIAASDAADAAFSVGGRRQRGLPDGAEAAGTYRRSSRPRLPAHAPLERVDRALAFCRRQQSSRGHRLRAAHRARLPHAHRSGDQGCGTCAGARPAHHSADC